MRAFGESVAMLFLLGGFTSSAQVSDEAHQQPATAAVEAIALPPSVSQVRIVRLSQVRGEVQLDRNIGRGYEDAFANIPIVNGARLRTGKGIAEIEFEDNSTLRLAPGSKVSFDQLGRSVSGATLSRVNVLQGTVYVSLAKTKDNLFELEDGQTRILVRAGSHVRLQAGGVPTDGARTEEVPVADPHAHLAVFDGVAQVETTAGPTAVAKKQTMLFDPSGTAPVVMARTETAETDPWDKSQDDYHRRSSNFTGSRLTAGAGLYGGNDLNYYGSFSNVGSCGLMWRPYFASAGWDPFANGTLAYYQGAGYSWVSPYPWGWLPYHSGSWQQCNGGAWGWRPGGQWYGLGNTPLNRTVTRLPHLPVRPGPHEPTLLQVNAKPIASSGMGQAEMFTFRSDSAGLGVPREGFGKLSSLSSSVERHGSVSSPVHVVSSGLTSSVGTVSMRETASVSSARSSASAARGSSSAMSSTSSGGGSHASAGGGGGGHH